MDHKQGQTSSRRPGQKAKKRYFKGNRYTSENDTNYTSTSAKKIKTTEELEYNMDPGMNYCIIQFTTVFLTLQQIVKCKDCNGDIVFSKNSQRGLGFKLSVQCQCKESLIPSSPFIDKAFEINRRLVFAMRMLGVGFQGINNFCGLMDLGHGLCNSTYYSIVNNIKIAAEAVTKIVFEKAVSEEIKMNEEQGHPANELSISGDGSWAKRGFSSLLGLVSIIGKYSNKILDVVVKSKICQGCSNWVGKKNTDEYALWYEDHKDDCDANHEGSSGKMEVDGIVEIFQRSEELYGVKYANYIGDGDTKTYKSLLEIKPYGDDFTVQKKECVLHVKKRLYKRGLEAKKKYEQLKKAKLQMSKAASKDENAGEDAKPKKTKKKSVGKDAVKTKKITNKLLQELSIFYGLAIRRHPDSLEDMKKEVLAGYYHNISTNENPQHSYCPIGPESWCKWRKSEAAGTLDSYEHSPALDDDAQAILKPVYESLTDESLLERCLGNNTQNNNESFNSCVWQLVPKHQFSGKKIVDIAACCAACTFNEGFKAILKMMDVMGIKIGPYADQLARDRDERRIYKADRQSTSDSKEARTARKKSKSQENEDYERTEGILYGAGIAD